MLKSKSKSNKMQTKVANQDANKTLLLVTSSCSSCVRTRKFFVDNNLPFVEENFYSQPISEKHFKDILSLSENGVYDIVSKRSKYLSSHKIKVDELKISELINLIHQHPSIVKRPILLQYDRSGLPKRLMIGYNNQDIKVFLRPIKDIEIYHSEYVIDDEENYKEVEVEEPVVLASKLKSKKTPKTKTKKIK